MAWGQDIGGRRSAETLQLVPPPCPLGWEPLALPPQVGGQLGVSLYDPLALFQATFSGSQQTQASAVSGSPTPPFA